MCCMCVWRGNVEFVVGIATKDVDECCLEELLWVGFVSKVVCEQSIAEEGDTGGRSIDSNC